MMAATSEKVLSKLSVGRDHDYYLLTTTYSDGEEGFDLALCDGVKAWCGSVTEDSLTEFSRKLKMDFGDFVRQTHKAFTGRNVGGIDFQYSIEKQGSDAVNFTWKKHITTENIKFQLGSVVLNKKENASGVVTMIFEHVLGTITSLQDQITNLQTDKERLMSERASALKRLEKCVVLKEEMEHDMYSKFAVVINDKKTKIRSLQEDLESDQAGASTTVESDTTDGARAKPPDQGHESSDDTDGITDQHSHTDYETDDDKHQPPTKKTKAALKTSTPAGGTDGEDDDLLLDDGSTKRTPAAPRRRRRQEEATKKTPSRPVIPKVSSTRKKPKDVSTPEASTSRVPSLRTRLSNTSTRSNRSSDQIDDLLDEMM